jgi:putative membrane protein
MGQGMMLSSMDKKFMMEAAMGGKAEVALAQLALQRSSSDSVKQYAQQMIDDHTKANDELMQVASTKGITLPTEPDANHKAMLAKMQTLSGAQFDSMYIKMAGVKDHEKMDKLFMGESSKGKDADAKAFAAKTLPTVEAHLRMARDMTTSMMSGKKGASMSH